ncbi:MAG TPA: hypothetical protein VNV66_12345 [Pilimelia sp.]|nr:hypothetical protein [Pilimelia sp.]
MSQSAEAPPPAPPSLRAAVGLVAAEAGALGLLSVLLAYVEFTATEVNVGIAVTLLGSVLGLTALLGWLARALARRRGGVRGLAVVLQLMLLPVGYYMIQGGLRWLGVPLIALGLVTAGLLLHPASTRALGLDHGAPGQ